MNKTKALVRKKVSLFLSIENSSSPRSSKMFSYFLNSLASFLKVLLLTKLIPNQISHPERLLVLLYVQVRLSNPDKSLVLVELYRSFALDEIVKQLNLNLKLKKKPGLKQNQIHLSLMLLVANQTQTNTSGWFERNFSYMCFNYF